MVGDDNRLLSQIDAQRGDCFWVFSPKPRGDGFFDIRQCFLFIFALRDTPRQSRTFRDNPAIFGLFERHMKEHGILQNGRGLHDPNYRYAQRSPISNGSLPTSTSPCRSENSILI
jgi:hypothetical protein